MQNTAFGSMGLDIEYIPLRVDTGVLEDAIEALRESNFIGANVTIPHKSRVIDYIDRVRGCASRIGSVNTIVNENGLLVGYNTDRSGALKALQSSGMDTSEMDTALILGAGDTARTIGFALAEKGTDLIICNRSLSKAETLADDLSEKFEGILSIAVGVDELDPVINEVSLIVNCTPVGLKGGVNGIPISPDLLMDNMTVFDLVYNPMNTPLVMAAREAGSRIVYGYRMLVFQGADSFRLWTGMEPPVSLMEASVVRCLVEPDGREGS
jgi:shikimate dehydrogenase